MKLVAKTAPTKYKLGLLVLFCNATFADNRASGMVPMRLVAGTLDNPNPLPVKLVANTLPEKITLLVSNATLVESSELGMVPVRFVPCNGAVSVTAFEALIA